MQDDVLSKDDLTRLKQKFAAISITGLKDFYFSAHYRCQMDGDRIPKPRDMQELVQAWKAMRKGT